MMFSTNSNKSFQETTYSSSMEAGRQTEKRETLVKPERYLFPFAHSCPEQHPGCQ